MTGRLNGHVDSYYAASNGNLPIYDSISGGRKTQVCIVGGGLAGLSCAKELAEHGVDVVLLEANRLAWGASGRNGGFVSDGFSLGMSDVAQVVGTETAKRLFAASVEGVEIVKANIEASGAKDIIQGHGGLKLIRTSDENPLRQQMSDYQTLYGVERDFILQTELRKYIHSNSYHAALYNKNSFHIDPLAYAGLLARDSIKKGVTLHENSKVTGLNTSGNGWNVVCEGGSVHADHVVMTTSGYGDVFRPITKALVPVATYVVASKPLGHKLDGVIDFRGTMADTRRAGDYFRIVGEGDARRLIWGGRITTRKSEPKELATMLATDIAQVFPQLAGLEIEYAWAGLMGYTRHKMPLIGQFWSRKYPNLWSCTGFGGHGLNTTAIGGRIVRQAITQTSGRIELFKDFKPLWTGGFVGRVAAQLSYWNMQRLDRIEEQHS